MKEKVRFRFYALYALLFLIIIVENLWIGKGQLFVQNLIALWTIFLTFLILGEIFSSGKLGFKFYMFLFIVLSLQGIIFIVIRNILF